MADNIQRKKVSDGILWGLFTIPVLGFICYLTFLFVDYHGGSLGLAIGFAAGSAVVVLGVSALMSVLARTTLCHSYPRLAVFAAFVTMLIVIGSRVWYLTDGSGAITGNLALYNDTMITEQVFVSADWLTDPFTALIQNLLRISFRLFGNTEVSAAFSLLLLQSVSALFFYFGVRNLSGHLGGLLATLLLFATPDSVRSIYDISVSHGVMAVFCVMLFLYSILIRLIRKGGKSAYMGVLLLFSILNGFLVYMDFAFVSLFLMVLLYYITYVSTGHRRIYRSFLILIHVLGNIAGFFLHGLVTCLNTEVTYVQVLEDWWDNIVGMWNPDAGIVIAGEQLLYLLIPVALVSVYMLYYWMRVSLGKTYLAFYGTSLLNFVFWLLFDMEYAGMFFFVSICILVAVMYQNCMLQKPKWEDAEELLTDEDDVEEDTGAAVPFDREKTVDSEETVDKKETVDKEETVDRQVVKPFPGQPLENPLPVPRKHVKRESDYAYQVPDEKMKFDIETDEQDDYDL